MKELGNREFWIRQTITLLAMYINRYLCIVIAVLFRVGQNLDPAWTKTVQGSSFPLLRPHRTGYLN